MKTKLDRLQRRSYRRHNRFKQPSSRQFNAKKRQNQRLSTLDWGSLPPIKPHWEALMHCFVKLPVVSTKEQAFEILWMDRAWDNKVEHFLKEHDPSSIVEIEKSITGIMPLLDTGVISKSVRKCLLSSIDSPKCFSSVAACSSVIVDSGASVCITPHRSDFLSYQSSSMKIKDLSSSNSVAGEGIVRWSFQGANGKSFSIEVVGYHIPTAEVRLLSPQVLLQTVGRHAFQHAQGIDFFVRQRFSDVRCALPPQ